MLQLRFEDFLEALVRFAHMKALPSEEELAESGLQHSGEFLDAMAEQPEKEDAFLQQRTREPDEECDLPIAWKVRQFVLWMLHTARGGYGNPEDELTKKEAKAFAAGHVRRKARVSDESEQTEHGGTDHGGTDDDEEFELRRSAGPGSAPRTVRASLKLPELQ